MSVSSRAMSSSEEVEEKESLFRRIILELRDNSFAYLLLVPSLVAFAALVIYPLGSTVVGAFSKTDAVGRIVEFGTLTNFEALAADKYMPSIIPQTVIFVFGSVILTILLSFPLAIILNQKFPGAVLARALILLPWAAPLAISAMTWRWIFHDQLGALNHLLHITGITQAQIVWLSNAKLAFAAVTFVEVWSSIPFMTIMFLAGLQAIPPHIYDAAKMDGANGWHEFWDMTLPQMKTITLIVGLLSVIWAFRSFNIIWTMTQGNPFYRTDISVTYLYKLAFKNLTFGKGYALAFATFLVLIVFSIIYTRVTRSQEEM